MSAEFSAPVRRADERPQTTGPPSPPRSPRPLRNARQLHAAVAQETDAEGRDAVAELVEGDHAAGHRCGDRGQFEHPSTGSSQHPPFWPIAASSDTVTASITRLPMPTRPGTATHPRSRRLAAALTKPRIPEVPEGALPTTTSPAALQVRCPDQPLPSISPISRPEGRRRPVPATTSARGPAFPREEQQEPCWC